MTTPALRERIIRILPAKITTWRDAEVVTDAILALVGPVVEEQEEIIRNTADEANRLLDEKLDEITRLRTALAEREGERDALRTVWQTVAEALSEWTEEIDAESICDAAIAAGLMERIEYDPEQHPDTDADEGDMIYRFTPLGQRLLPAGQPDAPAAG